MKPVVLLGFNGLRQQRWAVLLMVLYVAIMMGSFGILGKGSLSDLMVLFKQLAGYAIFLSLFISVVAVHNERRSRRILAVLSKGIERSQYLAGLLLGAGLVVGSYCLALALGSAAVLEADGLPVAPLAPFFALLMVVCLLSATLALFFSTFLHHWFALAACGVAVAIPAVLARMTGGPWDRVLPVYALTSTLLKFSPDAPWQPAWGLALLALGEAAALWLAASWVFARRDITVAVE